MTKEGGMFVLFLILVFPDCSITLDLYTGHDNLQTKCRSHPNNYRQEKNGELSRTKQIENNTFAELLISKNPRIQIQELALRNPKPCTTHERLESSPISFS
jgi:hypothetical protein